MFFGARHGYGVAGHGAQRVHEPDTAVHWLAIGAALDSFLGPDLGKGSVAAAGEGPPSQPTGTYGCRRTRVAAQIAGSVHVRVYSATKAGTIETVL